MKYTHRELRSLRLQLGWCQSNMARRLGIPVETYLSFEAGKFPIDAETEAQLMTLNSHLEAHRRKMAKEPLSDQKIKDNNLDQIHRDHIEENQN